jgi:hypothetical protein
MLIIAKIAGLALIPIILLFVLGAYMQLGLRLTSNPDSMLFGVGFWLAWAFAPFCLLASVLANISFAKEEHDGNDR